MHLCSTKGHEFRDQCLRSGESHKSRGSGCKPGMMGNTTSCIDLRALLLCPVLADELLERFVLRGNDDLLLAQCGLCCSQSQRQAQTGGR